MDPLSPSIVLAACAEPFLDGRRAVIFGDATTGLPEELIERGARLVHVYDPLPARAAEAAAKNRSRQISIVPFGDSDVAVRNGAFDVALVPDLSSHEDPKALLSLVRRATSNRGVAIFASPNPESRSALVPHSSAGPRKEPIGYYDLYDGVAAEFSEVKMLGQTPFVGYAVVDFAPDGEPDVSIDSGLVPGGAEEPEWFIAVASAEAAELDAISIVQLPSHAVVGAGEPKVTEELRAARAAEAHLIDRVAKLEVELAEQKKQAEARPTGVAPERVAELEAELSRRDERHRELELRAREVEERAEQAMKELEALKKKPEPPRDLEALKKQAEAAKKLEARLGELGAQRDGLAKKLEEQNARIEKLTTVAQAEGPDETASLEAALKERGERIRKLESDLKEAERIGKELVREVRRLGDAPKATPGSGPLAEENARLKADLEAAGWTIQELEGRLGGGTPAPR